MPFRRSMESTTKFQFTFSLLLFFFTLSSYAQTKLNGSYVATKVSYLSDEELPDENILKYTYVKYTFSGDDKLAFSNVYYENGRSYLYTIRGNQLSIKSEVGAVMNTMKIMENTANKLVLVSSAANGSLEDPWAIKYTLYKEEFIQKNLPLSPDDIFSIRGTDTLFKSGQKIYAKFKGPSFMIYVYDKMAEKKMEVKSGELRATFIIRENGIPDSLRIIQGINPVFDKEYIEAFKLSRYMWRAAQHNGKPVKVLMNQRLKYLTSDEAMPSDLISRKANSAYNDHDYELALYYYDLALESKPDEPENLYRRGICKQLLGNMDGACTDWNKIELMGNKIADELLLKYCK